MIPEVDHNDLEENIETYYQADKPLFVKGTTGIGKSQTVKRKAQELAEERGREFVEWNETTKQEKDQIRENIENHFLFIDIRLSEYEPSDIKGLPSLDGEAVEWKPPKWVKTATLPNAEGFIFLDEANLAPPTVQSAFYQLVLDKQLGEYALAEDVYVLGAGNRAGKDKANVYEMAAPLKDRFQHLKLQVPEAGEVEDGNWIDWAMQNELDDRVIQFLLSNQGEDKLFTFEGENKDADVFATPRSWEDVSDLLQAKGEDAEWEEVETLVSSSVGQEIAAEMGAFLEYRDDYDINQMIENPETVTKLQNEKVDVKYSVITAIATEYKHDTEVLENLVKMAQHLDEEFGILLLRMAGKYHSKHFKRAVREMDVFEELSDDWLKYFT